jgi:hypothetical protein
MAMITGELGRESMFGKIGLVYLQPVEVGCGGGRKPNILLLQLPR